MEKKRGFVFAIKIAFVFAGLIFGAGFASGREHLTFFLGYGVWGVVGILLAALVIGLCGVAVMDICVRHGIKDYRGFMFVVFGRKLGAVLDVVTGVFIFVLFSAMLAGAGAAGDQAFGLPFSLGAFALAALCFCVLLFDFKGIMEINTIITPILIIGAVGLGILAIFSSYTPVQEASQNVSLMPLSATVYAAYNMIPAIAVLAALQAAVPTRGVARAGGVLGGFFVAVVGLILAVALLLNLPVVANAELPMLALAGSIEPWVYYAYTAIIFLAIFTTAATNAFALIRWLEARTRFTKMQLKILICTLGVTAAHFGFSAMVSYAYTAFGFLGLFIITAIIVRFFRNK